MIKLTAIRAALVVVILAVVIAFFATPTVFAHAYLIRSEPAANSILTEPPQELRLWFSEPVSPEFSTAQILDINGQEIKPISIQVDLDEPGLMIVTLPDLSPSLYSLRWNVLSETDGHFTQGPLVFGVGEVVNLDSAVVTTPEVEIPWPEVLLRWLNFGTLMGLVGSVAIAYMVLAPGRGISDINDRVTIVQRTAQARALGWARWCTGAALVVGFGLMAWQIITLIETLPEEASVWGAGWQWINTRLGKLWLARQTLLLALVGLVVWLYYSKTKQNGKPREKLTLFVTGILMLALLIGQSLTSHAVGLNQDKTLAVAVDTLHLLAASLWVGGLLALVIGLLPLIRRHGNGSDFATLVRASWRPFSRLAALSVGLLIATGLYSTGRQIASIDALISTLYGQALVGKIGLMLTAGFFGLVNSILLHPRLLLPLAWLLGRPAGWTPLPLNRLPTLVMVETGLGLLVVLATGFITATPPARGPEFEVAPEDVPTMLSQTVDDMVISFSASPNRPGQNVFNIRAVSTLRPPPANVIRLMARFTFLGQEMGRTSVDAKEIEPGLYQAGGSHLSLAGSWQVQVVVRRAGMEDSVADFHWIVAPPGQARSIVISNRPLDTWLTTIASIILLLIPLTMICLRLRRNKLTQFSYFRSVQYKDVDGETLIKVSNEVGS